MGNNKIFLITRGKKEKLKRLIASVLACILLLTNTICMAPIEASDIWPQKSTDPFFCMDGGKSWRTSDRYEEVTRQEAGVTETQARRLFWAHRNVWEKVLKPALRKYDVEIYNQIKNVRTDANIVKKVKDDPNTMFAWIADNPEIEERAKTAIVKYISEGLEPGKIPPDIMLNSETGNYAIYENDAIKIQVGDFGPGSSLGQYFIVDRYFVSNISSIVPQTVYDNGSTGGAIGWIDASQDKNIATSFFGTKLYEISWNGDRLHIVNNGSQYANETILDPNVPNEVKFNKTIVRFKITMKDNSGYVFEGKWNENYLDEWIRFKVCKDAPDRQRLYYANINIVPSNAPFYIEVYQDNTPGGVIPPDIRYDVPFQLYRHEETFRADYNVRLRKMDAETGKPLKGSQFYLYERFDGGGDLSGSQNNGGLVKENLDFTPWDGFQIFTEGTTDDSGEIKYTNTRRYTYEKTYCNGHPAPTWADIPEAEVDDSTGEVRNQEAIDAAKDANRSAAQAWLDLADACVSEMDESDTHFHWLADESMADDIRGAKESGEPAGSGNPDISKEAAFERSGCKADCEETYDKFIHLKFTFTWKEMQAANGYILHGLHAGDLPVEMVTTDSSQAGAHSVFGGGYSSDIAENIWYGGHGGGGAVRERSREAEALNLYLDPPAWTGPEQDGGLTTPSDKEAETIRKYSTNILMLSLSATASDSDADYMESASNAKRITSASNAACRRSSPVRGKSEQMAAPSIAGWDVDGSGGEFESYLSFAAADGIRHMDTGDIGRYSHCNGVDGCGDSWRVFDHRTEGRIHINKRDLDLYRKEQEDGYSSYGDTEGDATLKGAVYGLFAAEDILHPDSQMVADGSVRNTGAVYRRNDLAAVAATDRNGDADFLAYTVTPGMTYRYESGEIGRRDLDFPGPENLYQNFGFQPVIDDYSADGGYVRNYQNNEAINGNAWIGRPLILGKYYVKELSRSEGYELSVNGISGNYTNRGAGLDTPAAIASAHGTAVLTMPELSASMEGEDGSGNGYDQIPFYITSSGTVDSEIGTDGYDIIVSGFPESTAFYRVDSGEEEVTGPHVTGSEEVIVRDETGEIVWKRAESDSSDLRYTPVYDGAGRITDQTAVSREEEQVMRLARVPYMPGMTIYQTNLGTDAKLREKILDRDATDDADDSFCFLKAKLEEMLRLNGYMTPRRADGSCSSENSPAYSRGIRKGDTDEYGQTTAPGSPAAAAVYGEGIVELAVTNVTAETTYEDFIATLLAWYRDNPEWNFGGIDAITKSGNTYNVILYAGTGIAGRKQFFTAVNEGGELKVNQLFVAYEYPADMRYVYQAYEESGEFAYEVERRYTYGSGTAKRFYIDAIIKPAMQANLSGSLEKVFHTVMVYHQRGEEIVDYLEGDAANGYRVPLKEQQEKIEITTEMEQVETDVPLTDVMYDRASGTHTIHVKASGMDHYGAAFTDEGESLKLSFLAKTAQKSMLLTETDIASVGAANVHDYHAGDRIGYTEYLMRFAGASVGVSVSGGAGADDTYIVSKRLIYRGQNFVSEDGDTRRSPVQVLERPVKQKIKVVKDIHVDEDGNYENNTNAVHGDAFTSNLGGWKGAAAARGIRNFRFKLYLKSNLERLCRDEAGNIYWTDKDGNRVKIEDYRAEYPELVQKIYTEKMDRTFPVLELLPASGGETAGGVHESARGSRYNYEKFFAAVRTAATDKWRRHGEIINSSFKPPAFSSLTGVENVINTSAEAKENAARTDAVRQFAIDWYLDEEVAALTAGAPAGDGLVMSGAGTAGVARYSEELYDRALYTAIIKAESYLKPFFSYDLDFIYSIAWDSESDGGIDKDRTTLSADLLYKEDGTVRYSYGISEYLPYGDYVLVEQQPYNPDWMDFANKHYRIDAPKELSLPAVYENGLPDTETEPEIGSGYYRYLSGDRPEDLARKFMIRFNEEWAENHTDSLKTYVVHAQSHDGNFELYPYGLDMDKAGGHYEPYGNAAVAEYYHYRSDSEQAGRDGTTATMTGVRTARDGMYAPMLVPWSMTEPESGESDCAQNADGSSSYKGFAYRKLHNTFYRAVLRVEKLDAETGEPILHDGAVFALYAAERTDTEDGNGDVKRYERDTVIVGSRQFLEAMGAKNLTPLARGWSSGESAGNTFYGTAPAGTPICKESECIILSDGEGIRTGPADAFSSIRDGAMEREEGTGISGGLQTTGYLETPEPVGAGVYVLAELKTPGGYARSKPIPIEIYSGQVSYYLDGDGRRTAASVFTYPANRPDGARPGGRENFSDTARIYVNDSAVRLEVSKVKTDDSTRRMKVSGRVEGSLTELSGAYGLENLELAYNDSGTYLGFGWRRGILEYLENRKAAGEAVELAYEGNVFQGYGYVTRRLETADEENRHVPGAVLALYDAIEVRPSGDREDFAFEGVDILRDKNGNVTDIKIKKGFAGEEDTFIQKDGIWTVESVARPDAPVLYCNLGDLKVIGTDRDGNRFGYDRNGKRQRITPATTSIFALKGGTPVLEITGGDLSALTYDARPGAFTRLGRDTVIYRLNSQLCRDAMVDGYTGLCYVSRPETGPSGRREEHFFVWPVKVSRDAHGNVIAREKILTGRPAEAGADTAGSYITGTVKDKKFMKELAPVFDLHGLVRYYQKSDREYKKGEPVYDRDGDFVRYRYADLLEKYNQAAYRIKETAPLYDVGNPETPEDDEPLWHRRGEARLTPNVWVTGEREPNNPDADGMTGGRADMLKRVYPGTYILEELTSPDGYVRAFPQAVCVEETAQIQRVALTDEKTKVEIAKVDGTDQFRVAVVGADGLEGNGDGGEQMGSIKEGKGAYTYALISGAELALYRAERVYTSDFERYPKGYYLRKSEPAPAAMWTTDGNPRYFEGLPAGDYILEESSAPKGYVKAGMDVTVEETEELQSFILKNDHTKLEIFKYETEDGTEHALSNAGRAELTIYPAVIDAAGNPVLEDGIPKYNTAKPVHRWETDDLSEYLEMELPETKRSFPGRFLAMIRGGRRASGFAYEYEKMYSDYGNGFREFTWSTLEGGAVIERRAVLTESAATGKNETTTQLWGLDNGKQVRVTVCRTAASPGTDGFGKQEPVFEYQYNYRSQEGVISYDVSPGRHRIDRIPEGKYVLVETDTPNGYDTAAPKLVVVQGKAAVQYYSVENRRKELVIDKVDEAGNQIIGAGLALYRADEAGKLTAEDRFLTERWISGSEGAYTQADAAAGRIPAGYETGDYRLHTIPRIADGTYYLVEETVPQYFAAMEPTPVTISAGGASVVRAVNRMAKGQVVIEKKDAADESVKLAGARFEIVNQATGESVSIVTGDNGMVVSPMLPVGTLRNGTVIPYKFLIREAQAPDFYQVSLEKHQFQFDPDTHAETIPYKLTMADDKTELTFGKTDFDTDMFVAGARLAVYKAKAENGKYEEDGPAVASWLTSASPHKVIGRLCAGQTYILKELSAPDGYTMANPILFTVSADGRKIINMTDNLHVIRFRPAPGGDAIESVLIGGRAGIRVMYTLMRGGEQVASWYGGGSGKDFTREELKDGEVYTLIETANYSDGNRQTTQNKTFRVRFGEDGNDTYHISDRIFRETQLKVMDGNGALIDSWTVDADNPGRVIDNPEAEEGRRIVITGRNGMGGKAVERGQVTTYQIRYRNESSEKRDMTIRAALDEGLSYVSSDGGKEKNGIITWNLLNIAPGEGGAVELSAAVERTAAVMVRIRVDFHGVREELVSPVASPGTLTVGNRLTGNGYVGNGRVADETAVAYQPEPRQPEFQYHISLTGPDGLPLPGIYSYFGLKDGELRTESDIKLGGDEFITISGLPWGTAYTITQREENGFETPVLSISGFTGEKGESAVFFNRKDDESSRQVFKAGETYMLEEMSLFAGQEGGEGDGGQITGRLAFALSESGAVTYVNMKDRQTHAVIRKTDITTGGELPGAHLVLKDSAGTVVDEWISEKTPHVIKGKLIAGERYTLCEDGVPQGYVYAEDITFQVAEDGAVQEIVMEDRPTHVELRKTDVSTGKELPGAHLVLKDSAGKIVDEWISGEEAHVLKGRLAKGETYTLHEESAPDGYGYVGDITFQVAEDGTVQKIVMEDRPTHVEITKTDISTGKELPGARLVLKNPQGEIVDEWTSGATAHVIKGRLTAGATYTLHEEGAPQGYTFAGDVTFTAEEDGTVQKIIMEDSPTHVEFRKTDFTTGKELPGAHLVLKDSSGTIVDEWISSETEHVVRGRLAAGETYTLHEEGTPDGYGYAEDITFTIAQDGSVQRIVMENRPTYAEFRKTDITTGKELPGARLVLKDFAGEIIDEWTSGEEAHVLKGRLIAGKRYILHEDLAPPGYAYSADVTFEVSGDGRIQKVVMEDKPVHVEIRKAAEDGGRLLGGAHMQLLDQKGAVVEEWISVKDEVHVIQARLTAGGIYTLRETEAPDGYELAADKTFTVSMDGSADTVTMTDLRAGSKVVVVPQISIRKYDAEMFAGLAGAEFTIYRPDGSCLQTVTTGEGGRAVFARPEPGTYFYRETKAPEGYMCSDEKYSFTVDRNHIVAGELSVGDRRIPDIQIEKRDADTKGLLPGAGIAVYDLEGNLQAEGVTDDNGRFIFRPLRPGTYIAVETKAPDGYELQKGEITFAVHPDGGVKGVTVMYDNRSRTEKPRRRVGTITAWYQVGADGSGKTRVKRPGSLVWEPKIPKSGDPNNPGLSFLGFLFFLALSALLVSRSVKIHSDKTKNIKKEDKDN